MSTIDAQIREWRAAKDEALTAGFTEWEAGWVADHAAGVFGFEPRPDAEIPSPAWRQLHEESNSGHCG
jgi:hypothetical protein